MGGRTEEEPERTEQVPEPVIRRMLGNMTLPRRFEAHEVAWLCV